MKFYIWVLLLCFALLANCIYCQTTRHVPSQYSTIQAGLNAAQSGDTVLVQPGTYPENIFWPSVNAIKLIAMGDTSNTIIDGRSLGTVITINAHMDIDSQTTIQGFTIKNGYAYNYGGGFFIDSASPKLNNLSIKQNKAKYGGGISIRYGCLLLSNSSIKSNIANGGDSRVAYGGGIYIIPYYYNVNNLRALPYKIDSCIFNDNESYLYGGAISVWSTTQVDSSLIANSGFINNRSVVNNSDESGGGAIFLSFSNTTIEKCEFTKNWTYSAFSDQGGGAINTTGAKLYIFNSKFINNSSGFGPGGALKVYYYTQIRNSLFHQNTAFSYGGGIYADGELEISNINFVENKTLMESPTLSWDGKGGALALRGIIKSHGVSFIRNKSRNGGSVYLTGTISGSITNNNFINNSATRQVGGIYFENNNGCLIRNSNFISNGTAIYNPNNQIYVDGINNYWGSTSGPYHPNQNSSGLGDSVNLFVNIIPFLTTPDTSALPIPVQNFRITSTTSNALSFTWDPSQLSDLASYKIYWDTDSSGYPYSHSQNIGNVNTFTLSNLIAGQRYYVAITCVDNSGNESWYSNEVTAQPIPPIISINVNNLDFPETAVGDSTSAYIIIKSANSSPIVISPVTHGDSAFYFPGIFPYTVNSGDSLKLPIKFKPTRFGEFKDTLRISSNGGSGVVRLSGSSPSPTISINPSSIDFGTITRNTSVTKTIAIKNASINKLKVDSSIVSSSVYTISNGIGIVSNHDSLILSVRFSPTEFGVFMDTLVIRNNSANSSIRIPLIGRTPIQIVLAGGEINFGNVPIQDSLSQDLRLTNIFNSSLSVDSIITRNLQFSVTPTHAIVAPGDTLKIKAKYTPSAFGVVIDTLKFINSVQGIFLKLTLKGNSPYPYFVSSTEYIMFDSTNVNTTVYRNLFIKNSSINTLTIDSMRFANKKYEVSSISISQIRRGDSSVVVIAFRPAIVGYILDTLLIYTNSALQLHKIALSGIGKNTTGISKSHEVLPSAFSLLQNYPNPFNPSTVIRYSLPHESIVKMNVFNSLGQIMCELENSVKGPGYYERVFDGSSFPSGIYFYSLSARPTNGEAIYHTVKKLLLIK